MAEEEIQSEFGKGLTYCLGLFLAHAEREREYRKTEEKLAEKDHSLFGYPLMWFNGAADHLFEMIFPPEFPPQLKARLHLFRSKCLKWRLSMNGPNPTWKDVSWAINEASELLREIDEHIGVETLEAEWK